MTREEGIHTTARIVEVLGAGRFRAALPNGKVIFAFLPRRLREHPSAAFQVEDSVGVRLTPYDFSKGEIFLLEEDTHQPEK